MSTSAGTVRHFHYYRLSDGRFYASTSCSDYPGIERAMQANVKDGEGVIETTGRDIDRDWDRMVGGQIVDTSDPKFAADLDAKWQRILAWRPTLANAVPPAPAPRQKGSFRFSCADIWKEFTGRAQRGEWSLRAPASTLDGLVGPFRAHGNCLAPVFLEGRLSWYDPALPAQDDDIVLVKWDARELQGIYKRGATKPEWLAQYSDPNPLATKLLKALGREYWLVTNDTMIELGRNRILGVLRREYLNEPVEIPNMSPNAATQIYTAEDDGPDSFNPAANGDGYLSLNGSGIDAASVLNGSLVIDAQVANVATILNIALQVTWSGGAESTASAQPIHTDARNYSFQHSFTTLPPNTAWTMRVAMSGNANATVQRASLRAEVIKR